MSYIDSAIKLLVFCLNVVSIIILLFGVVKAIWHFIPNELSKQSYAQSARNLHSIKNYLGTYILLGLEVLIAADIIETILNPTINDILMLAGIVLIRTVISYFLGKEIAEKED